MVIKNRKTFGIILLFIAFLFINIIPDPSDILTLQVYSAFTGADVSPSNLSVVYLDFIKWSLMVGIGLLLAGMYFLKLDARGLWKKLGIEKYKLAIFLAFLSVIVVSILNIKWIWLFFLIVPIGYWFTIRKDKSECVGLLGTSWLLYFSGLPTLISYITSRTPVPEILPSLNSNIFLSWLAVTLGFVQINNTILFLGIFISFLTVILFTRVLEKFL